MQRGFIGSLVWKALDADHRLRDQHRHRLVAAEGEARRAHPPWARSPRRFRFLHHHAHGFEHGGRRLPHRHLPGIELALLAAHGDHHQQREAAFAAPCPTG
jgi:hypothetical protein